MSGSLLSVTFFSMVGLIAGAEDQACNEPSCMFEEVESGLQMVQLKTSATQRPACPMPAASNVMHNGKRCPDELFGSSGSTCLNGNKAYTSMDIAWEACGKVHACGIIMQDADGLWYLRRFSDPDIMVKGVQMFAYTCLPSYVQGRFLKAENDACGWADADPNCHENNYAFVNQGYRSASNVNREEALFVCGRICAGNSTDCGGFWWDAADKACYFRKNARCGLKPIAPNTGDCYVFETEADRTMMGMLHRTK
mmetsp:Transcript_64537/g.123163  ORF Transcript_64537/g.123163 Transcript_64537/m.123163 type:complete len:253 (-) Transcript_64537:127-885(-)